jgi:hypothetical protein
MRLVGYGLGEIADRLTILELKILHGTAAGKDVEHFVGEQERLWAKITAVDWRCVPSWTRLAVVNAALWHAEDELRAYRAHGYQSIEGTVAAVAFRIQFLNDERARLVAEINRLSSATPPPAEKL